MSVFPLKSGEFRGIYPEEVNEEHFFDFGKAFAKQFGASHKIVTCRDHRVSSLACQSALNRGLVSTGAEVINADQAPTELIYHVSKSGYAGIVVTASHNPNHYNGLKTILPHGQILSQGKDLDQLNQYLMPCHSSLKQGSLICRQDLTKELVQSHFEKAAPLKNNPVKILAYALNGCGDILSKPLFERLNIHADWLQSPSADISPNPLEPRHTSHIKSHMQKQSYDLAIAWDGDADRCVFFTSKGDAIPSIYISGLIAKEILKKDPASNIVCDIKLIWHLQDTLRNYPGNLILSQTGHLNLKQSMKAAQAAYGAEQSGHHYFGNFLYCDSGVLPWIHVLNSMQNRQMSLDDLVSSAHASHPLLPEINLELRDIQAAESKLQHTFEKQASEIQTLDGVSYHFDQEGWRFNFRASKTEPVARLNLEGRINLEHLIEKRNLILQVLEIPESSTEKFSP